MLWQRRTTSGLLPTLKVKLPGGSEILGSFVITVAIKLKNLYALNVGGCSGGNYCYFIEDKTSKIEDLYNDYKNEIMKTDFTGDYLVQSWSMNYQNHSEYGAGLNKGLKFENAANNS